MLEDLTAAYKRFKRTGHADRMILFLALQMGQEYLHVQNYDMAKRFFERNGMHVHKHSPLLRQTEMRLHRADFPMWSTLYKSQECK